MSTQSHVFPLCDQPSDRDMDLALVRQLVADPTADSTEEITQMSLAHAQFLNHGGGGGVWQMLSVAGLPLCIYMGPEVSSGTQMVLRLKNVQGASLIDAQLDFADMSGACVQGVDFSGSSMRHVMAIDSIFDGATFAGCDLSHTDFSGASLEGANFEGADLTGVDFEKANLTGANFKGATLTDTRFPGAKLDGVRTP